MTSIAENISRTLTRIREAERRYQRIPGSVRLMAVSKTRSAEEVREAFGQGVQDFGENYLQDALPKIESLRDLDICWHFIGPLQSNKTRAVAETFDWVHSLDRLKIARRLDQQRPAELPPLNLCIQVNISGEASKSGVEPAELEALLAALSDFPRLRVRGLMAIPEAGMDEARQRQTFGRLQALFDQARQAHPQMDTLSMGMSQDMEAAVAQGSTMVRIGTAIFGPRAPR